MVDVGYACAFYQNEALRNLPCKRVQCHEIWAFCASKEKNTSRENKREHGHGDVWTWTVLCADTKLIVSWMVGGRSARYAMSLMEDLKGRLANRVQLTTDGHKAYLRAVEETFGSDIDYAMLVKLFGEPAGNPKEADVSTSYVKRQNLTMRMGMRRFTRLTNGFSKKIDNHEHAIALHFMYYNFGRIHKTLRVTPAMEAGIADHVWTLEEIAKLAD